MTLLFGSAIGMGFNLSSGDPLYLVLPVLALILVSICIVSFAYTRILRRTI